MVRPSARRVARRWARRIVRRSVQAPGYRDAKFRTATSMLPDLLGPDAAPFDLRFTGPDGADVPAAQLILVSNDPYQLDYVGGLGTRERLDGGVLGIVAARIGDAGDAGTFAALEAAGQVRRFPGWQEWSAPRFEVSSDGEDRKPAVGLDDHRAGPGRRGTLNAP